MFLFKIIIYLKCNNIPKIYTFKKHILYFYIKCLNIKTGGTKSYHQQRVNVEENVSFVDKGDQRVQSITRQRRKDQWVSQCQQGYSETLNKYLLAHQQSKTNMFCVCCNCLMYQCFSRKYLCFCMCVIIEKTRPWRTQIPVLAQLVS